MTLKHSPGPWVFDERDFAIYSKHACVATFASDELPTEADGRLIAAAPDMLRLLRVIADIPLEQARLGIGPKTAIKEARKMLKELDGDQ
jgi:hypothetical protein